MYYEELVKSLRNCVADENGCCFRCPEDCNGPCQENLMTEAADAIEELSKQFDDMNEANIALYGALPKWIPVTEKLPENQRPVLVCVPPYTDGEEESVGYVGMADFTDSANGGFWCGTDGNVYGAIGIIHEPLYWMPLPEPPQEE